MRWRGGCTAVLVAASLLALVLLWTVSRVTPLRSSPLVHIPLHVDALEGGDADRPPRVFVLIVSSYSRASFARRETVRSTWLQFAREAQGVVVEHRFVLGQASWDVPPWTMWRLARESAKHDDLVFVPSVDTYGSLSMKTWLSMQLASLVDADFVIKTDDDCYVRLDTMLDEMPSWPREGYWSGLVNSFIPPLRDSSNKNSDWSYPYKFFPPFTAGAMHVMSGDVVRRLAANRHRKLLMPRNEDQALGLWLFALLGHGPVHDRRIQQWHTCEDDLIVKHFFRNFDDLPMEDMHSNVLNGRPLCTGFQQRVCAACYPCQGRETDYADWGYGCSNVDGLYLL